MRGEDNIKISLRGIDFKDVKRMELAQVPI
jgi:hypothetical protein